MEITEDQEENAKQKVKSKWARVEAIVGSEKRIKELAQDIVNHFEKRLEASDGKGMIVPLEKFGIKLMSIGLLVDEKNAIVWRGPMASSAIRQFVTEVHWDELDYLIIDMPPGTGDIHLTLVQTVPVTGTGFYPQMSLSALDLTFAPQAVSTTSAGQTITINNNNTNLANTITVSNDLLVSGTGAKTLALGGVTPCAGARSARTRSCRRARPSGPPTPRPASAPRYTPRGCKGRTRACAAGRATRSRAGPC